MTRNLLTLARMTLLEQIRDRTLFSFACISLLLLVLSFFLGSLSLDEQLRIMVHLGLSSLQLTLVGLGLFLGSFLLRKEIDRQTCLIVLAKNMSRLEYLLGLTLGTFFVLFLVWAGWVIAHLIVSGTQIMTFGYFALALSIFVEAFSVFCLALMVSMWLRPILAWVVSFSVWLTGHWLPDLEFFARKSGDFALKSLAQFLSWAVPPYHALDVRSLAFVQNGDPSVLWYPLLVVFFWSTLALFFAQMKFRGKDLV